MAESAGALSFGFEADFSGFTRAAQGASQTLDRLARDAGAWADTTSSSVSRSLGAAATVQSSRTRDMATAWAALTAKPPVPASGGASSLGLTTQQLLAGQTIKDTSGDKDDNSAKILTQLSEQLALLQTTGAAHDKIVDRMKTEAEQAKLGTDATTAEKNAVAGLVQQIDAAKAAQEKLQAAQEAMNRAWTFGTQQVATGIEALVLDGAKVGDVAASALRSVARQGLQAALTGAGPFAAAAGTQGANGTEGGIFGALGKALTGSFAGSASGGLTSLLGGSTPSGSGSSSSFAGLFAEGGAIGAGQWGIVGEQGAEVVAGPASVMPWDQLSGAAANAPRSTQVINFNVTAPDPAAFANSQSQMSAVLARAVGRGQRNM
jgi:hypothetical protein